MTTQIYTIYNQMDIAYTQAAYQLSSFAYPLKEIGLLDWQEGMDAEAQGLADAISSIVNSDEALSIQELPNDMDTITSTLTDTITKPKDNIADWIADIQTLRNTYDDLNGIIKVKKYLCITYVNYYINNYFEDGYMEQVLHVTPSLINYSDSKFFYVDEDIGINNLITIAAEYNIDIPFPIPFGEITLNNSVTLRGVAGN